MRPRLCVHCARADSSPGTTISSPVVPTAVLPELRAVLSQGHLPCIGARVHARAERPGALDAMSSEQDRESISQALAPAGAVFLSYASEDAAAAERIATALRSAGIEVWFDKSELRGGDAWDRQIRQQIHDCRLFIAVISAHTEARDEGYFRREWKLAVDRTHDMDERKAFLVPVVIDATSERGAHVPEKFGEVQWTRLPSGETSTGFVERVRKLLSPGAYPVRAAATTVSPGAVAVPRRSYGGSRSALWVIGAVLAVAVAYLIADKFWSAKHSPVATATEKAAPSTNAPPATAAAFSPPPHSVAVLPFVNMSGDKDQEYFSEGLTEELLNSLSRINELQVAARTSSFSFQGEDPDIATVAHKLNVGAVLEGSVRRSAHTVRVTAQLINAVTGFHMWSQTYDRNLGDVLQLQTEIATAVANALKVTLLGNEAQRIEIGGTHNPAAFDAYLRATKAFLDYKNSEDLQAAIAAYAEAIRLDPKYAVAYAALSRAHASFAQNYAKGPAVSATNREAVVDARKAIALAPDLGLGHAALARAFEGALEFALAAQEYDRAIALEPSNSWILSDYGDFAVCMGRVDAGLNALRRAVALDPLNSSVHNTLGLGLMLSRRQEEAIRVFGSARALGPNPFVIVNMGVAQYLLGDYQSARSSCEQGDQRDDFAVFCLAITYDKLGRRADAEAMLTKLRTLLGNADITEYVWLYAQWGRINQALDELETALRVRDPYLIQLKMAALVDPLRNEPRFQAIERALKFPD